MDLNTIFTGLDLKEMERRFDKKYKCINGYKEYSYESRYIIKEVIMQYKQTTFLIKRIN